jgi:opacity protein-like surface antigen
VYDVNRARAGCERRLTPRQKLAGLLAAGLARAVLSTLTMTKSALVAVLLATLSSAAGAQELAVSEAAAPGPRLTLGARVGGYGFRAPAEQGKWNQCRMNGLGVFGELDLHGPWFLEAGLDGYFSDDLGSVGPAAGGAERWPIDRVSGLLTVAGGARLETWRWFQPYVQLGVGMEWTRVRVAGMTPLEDSALLPVAFLGLGGDLRVTDRLAVGASLRLHAMGLYSRTAGETPALSRETELASQAQFYAKFAL